MTRPSALPMLAECPKFMGSESEYTEQGQTRHTALARYLGGAPAPTSAGPDQAPSPKPASEQTPKLPPEKTATDQVCDENAFASLSEDEQENMLWAADYIKLKAPLLDHPLVVERLMKGTLPNGLPIQGTPDFVCGNHIFDLKWRPRDYASQMACYAWMLMEEKQYDSVVAHLLFAQTQTIRILRFDGDTAWGVIKPILDKVNAPFAAPTPCTFCGWCAKKLTCEALAQQVNIALKSNPEWDLTQWHSSQITNAKEMGQALRIARTLKEWCESVEYHAKELAMKRGLVPEGFTLHTRRGRRAIEDVVAAYHRANLPQKEFLAACVVKARTLFDIYARFHGMKKTDAERDLETRLGETMKRGETTIMLSPEKLSKD